LKKGSAYMAPKPFLIAELEMLTTHLSYLTFFRIVIKVLLIFLKAL